jgi:hypothetical protein
MTAPNSVIPAKAGIHGLTFPQHTPAALWSRGSTMDPRVRGDDNTALFQTLISKI